MTHGDDSDYNDTTIRNRQEAVEHTNHTVTNSPLFVTVIFWSCHSSELGRKNAVTPTSNVQ